jgi:hypothetical protein
MNNFIANHCLEIGLIIAGLWMLSIIAVCVFFGLANRNRYDPPEVTDAARILMHHDNRADKKQLKTGYVLFLRSGKGFN